MGGADGRGSRLRVGGWLPEDHHDFPERDADPDRAAGLGAVTQDLDGGYEPAHPGAPEQPEWTDPPSSEPTTWTRSATPWIEPAGGREPGGATDRGGWRSPHSLFRRRYNTAAIVTIAAVAAVLFLLAMIPVAAHNRQAAAAGMALSPSPSPSRTKVRFQPVTMEAESAANTLIGSARVGPYDRASGGMLVRAIGKWGSPKGLGALRFNDIVVPADGFYVLTFYFVNIGGQAARTATITASGFKSVMVTVASTSVCCTPQAVTIFLLKGQNTVTFSNTTGEAPAIDRIIISRR